MVDVSAPLLLMGGTNSTFSMVSSDSEMVLGSIISFAASTRLIFFSPFSTSDLALLYMYNPTNVRVIPKP